MSLTRSRVIQYLTLIALAFLAGGGYWYFSVRASTLNKSPVNSLTSGLVGYWTFDGADISGTTATDRGSGGGNGTLTGSPSPTPVLAKMGQGLSFDGANNYVDVADSTSLSMAGSLTLSIWFKANALPGAGSDAGLVQKSGGNCSYALNLTTDNGPKQAYILVSKNNTCTPGANMAVRYTNTAFVAGQWYHLVGVLNTSAQTLNIYVNGVLDNGTLNGTVPTSVFDNIDVLRIGRAWSADYFNGTLDEVRVYNRALSASEIESLYRLGESDKVNSSISQPQGVGRLDSGLALYWPLDASSGTTATDSSTNGNNGTLTNMEDPGDWVSGQIGNALDFDGVNEYVATAGDRDLLDALGPTQYLVSVSAWFNRDTFTTDDVILAKKSSTGGGGGYALYVDDATDKVIWVMYDNTDSYSVESSTTFTATGWHHVVVSWKDDALDLYIDGRKDNGTVTGTLSSIGDLDNALAFRIGATNSGEYFDGKLDEIRVYHRALSADEISRLYKTTSPTNPDTSLKGYWSFDGPTISGTSVRDLSGAGNNGTLTNGPTVKPGKIGQGMNFDGSDDYVYNFTPAITSTQRTIAAWIYPRTIGEGGVFGIILDTGSEGGGGGVSFSLCSGDAECSSNANTLELYQYFSGNDGIWHTGANTIKLNEWNHVVVTYDSSSTTNDPVFYINGTLSTTYESGTPTGTRNVDVYTQIGSSASPSNLFTFDGLIDEVRVYNRALSPSEIESLYRLGESDKVNSSISQPQGVGRLESGLALYWPLDASSGTTATDSSTNGNNGTLTNMEDPGDWVTGQIGNALDFDGVNEYVTLADPSSGVLDFADSTHFSLTGWFNRDTFTTDDTIIAKSNGQTAADTGYNVYIDDATDKLTFVANDGTDQYKLESVSTFTATGWHHFALSWDDTTSAVTKLAIDGRAEEATATGTFANVNSLANALAFRVGAESDGGNPFDGKLDEIRVYHRALSADEISRLYRTTSPTNPETGLKGYWSFNGQDTNATTAFDRSGSGNDGTLTNGPTKTPGKLGQALSFDGTDDKVNCGDTTTLRNLEDQGGGGMTVMAWVKPRTAGSSGGKGHIVGKENNDSGPGDGSWGFSLDGTSNKLVFGHSRATQPIAAYANNAWATDTWQHVAVTFNGGTVASTAIHLYANGTELSHDYDQDGSGAYSTDAGANLLIGGGYSAGSGWNFDGLIDDVRVYNRVLSATEIQALYNQGR